MKFLERLLQLNKEKAHKTALINAATGSKVSYGKLYELSGRIYAYLKKAGIGREDVVMVYLPRGIRPLIVAVGIWRAGAAIVLLESDGKGNKKEYVYKDSKARLLVDDTVFEEMMREASLDGFEDLADHQLSHIIYTSGTQGISRGVLQEVGSRMLCVQSAQTLIQEEDRLALSGRLQFAATYFFLFPVLYQGATLLILSRSIVTSKGALNRCLKDYNINTAFFVPSLLAPSMIWDKTLKKIFVAGEIVRQVYYKNLKIFALYGQSESGYICSAFPVDAAYRVTPIGKALLPEKVFICNEKGEQVKVGEQGELCYYNPYFRGYSQERMSQLCQTNLKNGWVASGDLAYYRLDGNMEIIGRRDDMVKLNGMRVELNSLEEKIRHLTGLEWLALNLVEHGGRRILCAYFKGTSADKPKEIRQKLVGELSEYMIPAVFQKLDYIPLNENGKFSRKLLPMPAYMGRKEHYRGAHNLTEAKICETMGEVLHLDQLGIDDDFFELGGDSLTAVKLMNELDWPLLSIDMIYQGRTAEKIAALYLERTQSKELSVEEKNEKVLLQAALDGVPLSPTQSYMYFYQTYSAASTMWNLPLLLRFDKENTVEAQLIDALKIVLKNHPVFSTIYTRNNNQELVQEYHPELQPNICIYHMSEREAEEKIATLLQPFTMIDSPLYRIYLISTEEAVYLFMDFHHSIVDGTSLHILLDDINKAYHGNPLETDYYYLHLQESSEKVHSSLYEEGRNYYQKLLDEREEEWSCFPQPDHEENNYSYANYQMSLMVSHEDLLRLKQAYGLTPNAFYLTAAVLAISRYNNKKCIKLSWVFNGRESLQDRHIVGSLIKDCYVGIELKEDMSLQQLFDEVLGQIENNLKYSAYPYPGPERMYEGEDASLLYQSELRSFEPGESTNENILRYEVLKLSQKQRYADNLMDLEILENKKGVILSIDYIASKYDVRSIENFSKIYEEEVQRILTSLPWNAASDYIYE